MAFSCMVRSDSLPCARISSHSLRLRQTREGIIDPVTRSVLQILSSGLGAGAASVAEGCGLDDAVSCDEAALVNARNKTIVSIARIASSSKRTKAILAQARPPALGICSLAGSNSLAEIAFYYPSQRAWRIVAVSAGRCFSSSITARNRIRPRGEGAVTMRWP